MFGWMSTQPTPAQKQLGQLLFDESIHVISSFELNRVASLTYGEMVCDEIFEMLEQIESNPMEHSILAVQKSLVVTKHILIYGSEKCVNSAIALQRPIETLLEYNTVLWAQKKLQGASAFMYKLKGGGVDKGYPVREAAKDVHPLIFDLDKLRRLRISKADPNSLVPVGNENVAFVSDDVRHYMLKKRIQEQYIIHTKSNLVKADDGFGAGYSSTDGKSVVGAAHSLDEMIKRAEMAKQKFSDEGCEGYQVPNLAELSDYKKDVPARTNIDTDLLWSGNEHQNNSQTAVGDLLDFSSEVSHPASAPTSSTDVFSANTYGATGDLLGNSSAGHVDIFLNAPAAPAPAPDHDFMGFSSINNASSSSAPVNYGDHSVNGVADSMTMMNLSENFSSGALHSETKEQAQNNTAPQKKSVMASNEDRFAALDALEVPETKKSQSIFSSALDAKNRLMGLAGGSAEPTTSEPSISVSSTFGSPETNSAGALGGIMDVNFGMSESAPSMGYDDAALASTSMSSSMQGLGLQNTTSFDKDPSSYSAPSSSNGLMVSQAVSAHELSSPWVAGAYANGPGGDDDGFVMGGTMGSGLEPTAPAPGAPPPPPPPSWHR